VCRVVEELALKEDTRWMRSPCLVHGDLIPSNILVVNGRVMLIDFEFSRWGDVTMDLAKDVTRGFMRDTWNQSALMDGYLASGPAYLPYLRERRYVAIGLSCGSFAAALLRGDAKEAQRLRGIVELFLSTGSPEHDLWNPRVPSELLRGESRGIDDVAGGGASIGVAAKQMPGRGSEERSL
jgi:serine/threonine protein kinase